MRSWTRRLRGAISRVSERIRRPAAVGTTTHGLASPFNTLTIGKTSPSSIKSPSKSNSPSPTHLPPFDHEHIPSHGWRRRCQRNQRLIVQTRPFENISEHQPLLIQNNLHNAPRTPPQRIHEMKHPPDHETTLRLSHVPRDTTGLLEAEIKTVFVPNPQPVFEIPPRLLGLPLAVYKSMRGLPKSRPCDICSVEASV
jgi:hypothetical protein